MMSSPRESTQAIAAWASVTPLLSATARSASATARFWSRFSSLKRGALLRKSLRVFLRSRDQWPEIRPRESTP